MRLGRNQKVILHRPILVRRFIANPRIRTLAEERGTG